MGSSVSPPLDRTHTPNSQVLCLRKQRSVTTGFKIPIRGLTPLTHYSANFWQGQAMWLLKWGMTHRFPFAPPAIG